MTQAARVYGGSLYDLATEEKLDGQIMEQMNEIRQIFRENPGYLKFVPVRSHQAVCPPFLHGVRQEPSGLFSV